MVEGHLVISAAGFVDLGKNYVCSTMEALYVALLLYLPSTQPPAQSARQIGKFSTKFFNSGIHLTKLTLQFYFSKG